MIELTQTVHTLLDNIYRTLLVVNHKINCITFSLRRQNFCCNFHWSIKINQVKWPSKPQKLLNCPFNWLSKHLYHSHGELWRIVPKSCLQIGRIKVFWHLTHLTCLHVWTWFFFSVKITRWSQCLHAWATCVYRFSPPNMLHHLHTGNMLDFRRSPSS